MGRIAHSFRDAITLIIFKLSRKPNTKPKNKPKNMKPKRILPNTFLGILTASALALSTGSLQAALLAPFIETFSGGGGGSANTSVYTLASSTTSTAFTKEITTVVDGSFLDNENDGYARLTKTDTTSQSPAITGIYGTIDISDVGKTVSIDAGFRHVSSMSNTWAIQLNGVNVETAGGQSILIASSFTTTPANQNVTSASNTLLSEVLASGSNPGRTTGALTYTFLPDDVGKTLGLRVNFFEGSGANNRRVLIDSISYSVIPEPSSALLGGLGMIALLRRRR